MEKNNILFSHTSYEIINNNKFFSSRVAKKQITFQDLIKSCDIGLSTVVINKNHFRKKIFFPNIKTKEDYLAWLKITRRNINAYSLPETLVIWKH